jgi:restriction system protein
MHSGGAGKGRELISTAYHYPPDLFELLVQTIPLLCRSKQNVLTFFKGAGVEGRLLSGVTRKVNEDKASITKYEIVRTVLEKLNEKGDATLAARREVLRRIVEFEDFSTCWPDDRLKAQGLVAQIRQVVNVKDSFTRMREEREHEQRERHVQQAEKQQQEQQRREVMAAVKADLFALFGEQNPHRRGKKLEGVLNRLFDTSGILIREAFAVTGSDGEGIVEQIDGEVYLVEMKWWNEPLGVETVSQHLVRVFNRGQARGIFISASGYTEPAVKTCRESLHRVVLVLCNLQEIVMLMEKEEDLKTVLKEKIRAAIVHKNPFYEPLSDGL